MSDVRLREVQPEDLPVLFANQADPEGLRMAVVPTRTREAFDAHWEKLLEDPTVLNRAIELDGKLAGFVGAWNRDGERQVGYWVGRAYWGRGAATEALRQLLTMEKHRPLHAHVVKTNAGSVRVLEKCGFCLQSTALIVVNDAYEDVAEGVTLVDLLYRLDA